MMTDLGKTLVIIGGLIVLTGLVMTFMGKVPGMGKLPGDIFIKKENFTFYFPITTCIVASIVLSLLFYLLNKR